MIKTLFRLVGRNVVKYGGKQAFQYGARVLQNQLQQVPVVGPILEPLLFNEHVAEIAEGTLDDWKKESSDDRRRAELQEIAQAAVADARKAAAEVAAELAANQAEEVRVALRAYLEQLPHT